MATNRYIWRGTIALQIEIPGDAQAEAATHHILETLRKDPDKYINHLTVRKLLTPPPGPNPN